MNHHKSAANKKPTIAKIKLACLQPTRSISAARGTSPNIAPTELIDCAIPARIAKCCRGNQRETNTSTPIKEKAEPIPIRKRPIDAVTTLSVDAKKKEPIAQSIKAPVISLRGP